MLSSSAWSSLIPSDLDHLGRDTSSETANTTSVSDMKWIKKVITRRKNEQSWQFALRTQDLGDNLLTQEILNDLEKPSCTKQLI